MESSNSYITRLGLSKDPFNDASDASYSVAIGSHDQLLSRIVDDAFYGRPLIAVTGENGSGKTSLIKRFVSQYAGEAECLVLNPNDFSNRDNFLDVIVSKLSPEAVDYAADSPLITIADYAGSLADQERLLILIVDDAETISPAFLEVIYELVDEADEASLCCILVGESSLTNIINRVDPDGGIEDFTWFELLPLNDDEIRPYIQAKLVMAGFSAEFPLDSAAIQDIFEASGGIPAVINGVAREALERSPSPAASEPEVHLPEEPMEAQESDAMPEVLSVELAALSDDGFEELIELVDNNDGDQSPEEQEAARFEQERAQISPTDPNHTEAISTVLGTEEENLDLFDAPIGTEASDADDEYEHDSADEPEDEDDFDRDIDGWLEADEQPRIGAMPISSGEELEFDFDDDDESLDRGSDSARTQGQRTERPDYLAAARAAIVALPARLAAARVYWFAAAGLALLVIAVMVFWRIPEERSNGTIELTLPLASEPEQSAAVPQRPLVSRNQVTRPAVTNPLPQAQPVAPTPPAVAAAQPLEPEAALIAEPEQPTTTTPEVKLETVEASPPSRPSVAASTPVAEEPPEVLAGNAFEREIIAAPGQSYTVQILAAGSEANVQEFVSRNASGLRQTLGYYRSTRAGRPWFVVSYGVFANRADAQATLRRLPEALSQAGPWVRQLSGVQAEIRQAR